MRYVVAVHIDAGCRIDPEGRHPLHLRDLLQVAGIAAVEASHDYHHVRPGIPLHHLIDSILPFLQWLFSWSLDCLREHCAASISDRLREPKAKQYPPSAFPFSSFDYIMDLVASTRGI